MKRIWALFVSAPLFAAGIVPDRYIVELSGESVAEHVLQRAPRTQSRLLLRGPLGEQQRRAVRAEQLSVRSAVRAAEGEVIGAVENIQNALVVRIAEAKAARLSAIPGVRKVYPVREFKLLLDHALPLHRVPEAWTKVGEQNAGAGAKIAIIDTGVDLTHPGFQDAGFSAPEGFPRALNDADLVYTNNKVIVARSYADMFRRADPDPSPADAVGHGTATAMAAAGVRNAGPLATISGVAPRAWIGSYKVFGTPGVNDGAPEDAILKAIDDAVADGMDVISMSLGSDIALRLEDDFEMQALEKVAALGIIVVVASGNNGPDPATVGSPAAAPSAIAVGASANDRIFSAAVIAPERTFRAMPGSGFEDAANVAAPLADVAPIDGDGLACKAIPADSLSGTIALLQRGTCTFEEKLNNARAAGAAGAIVYDNIDGASLFIMSTGTATLPAQLVSYQDGLALKQSVQGHPTVTLQFALTAVYEDPSRLAGFSAKGPNLDNGIKPDLVAVGASLYTASPGTARYVLRQGTSFSAPIVAGAAALLKAARPGLTAGQYRSLLVNSARPASLRLGTPARVQQAGAGSLDLEAALNSTAAVEPVSLTFGAGGSTVTANRSLTLWNLGTVTDTFQLSVAPLDGGPAPVLGTSTIELVPGGSARVQVQFESGFLGPGQYEGAIEIRGAQSTVTARVPYWYAVASDLPANITLLHTATSGTAGGRVVQAIIFRITDEAGLPVAGVEPTVTASGGGRVTSVSSVDPQLPGGFIVNARLGIEPGQNVFRIQVGEVTKEVVIVGQ